MLANEAVLNLYDAGVEISKIQKCFSIGMLGKKRKLTPTKWSITATDDIISKWLVHEILEMPQINSYETYHFEHLGNLFSIVLFPHRWMYEMIEAVVFVAWCARIWIRIHCKDAAIFYRV